MVVAVIDTGIDFEHPFLADHIHAPGYDYIEDRPVAQELANGIDEDLDGLVDEAHGHGTHIASTILRVNPSARILPLRVMSAEGHGSTFDVANAIEDAVAMGAQVINLSLSVVGSATSVREALAVARDAGVAVYSSAGNTGSTMLLFPASDPWVSAVASVDASDRLSGFSAHGFGVSFSAPGENIYGALPGNRWGWWSGTSMACAVASGMASLALSATTREVPPDAVAEIEANLGWPPWLTGEHETSANLLAASAENIQRHNIVPRWDLGWGRLDAKRLADRLFDDAD